MMRVVFEDWHGERGSVYYEPVTGLAIPDPEALEFLQTTEVHDPNTGEELTFADGKRYLGAMLVAFAGTYFWARLDEDTTMPTDADVAADKAAMADIEDE